MISVIIPVYNKAAYLGKCLHSVMDQTFREFEVIVVNDGSTDRSLELVKNLLSHKAAGKPKGTDSHFLGYRIICQKNSGVSTARNNGVKAAKYDYVAFLDADDWWAPGFLEGMKKLIDVCPDAALYGCNYFYVKNQKNRVEFKGLSHDFNIGYIDYIRIYGETFVVPVNCSFAVVKKHVFREVGGFNPNLKFGEDFDLWIRLALKYPVGYNNRPLAYSNQDVPVSLRALGQGRRWSPDGHFIFNLGYLQEEEQQNSGLKKLLDGLRVRNLLHYYMNGWNKAEVKEILSLVDFDQQPVYFRRIYSQPRTVVRILFRLRSVGSYVKQTLIRFRLKLTFCS